MIHYEKAFDTGEIAAREISALRYQGVEDPKITVVEVIYDECTATIILLNKSGKFPIRKGVREGNTISPQLFKPFLESGLWKVAQARKRTRAEDILALIRREKGVGQGMLCVD